MAPDQQDAIRLQDESPSGEFPLPQEQNADIVIAEYERESVETDSLIAIADTVSGMAETLANGPEGETISEATATALGIAVEGFQRMAGIPPRPVFALEQFSGGYASRREAQKIAMEGMTDVVKKITVKIVKFLRRVMEYLYGTMQELIFGADNMLKAAQEIQNRARAIAHKDIKEDQQSIDDARLVHFFTKDDQVYSAAGVLEAYKGYNVMMKNAFSAGFVKEVGLRVHETLAEAVKSQSSDATHDKIDKIMNGMLSHSFHDFKKISSKDHADLYELALPFGQRRLVLLVTRNVDTGTYDGFNVTKDNTQAKAGKFTERKLETMDYASIMKLSKEVENQMLFGIYKSYKTVKGDLDRIKAAIEKGCDQVANHQQSTARNSQTVAYSLGFLKDIASSLVATMVLTHRYDIETVRHLLEYCNRSVKLHG